MFATLGCPPVGRGNVCIFIWSNHYIIDFWSRSSCDAKLGYSSFQYSRAEIVPDYAINNKLTPFVSMQNHYNLLYREEEREMLPTLKVIIFSLSASPASQRAYKYFNVGAIPWSPLARGLLTRPLDAETIRGKSDR